jgi:hypothetical protein
LKDRLVDRFAELFSEKGEKFAVFNNTIFFLYNGMVVPFAPVNEKVHLPRIQAADLLNRLGGKLIRWNSSEFDLSGTPEWYALICRNFTSIDDVNSKLRNELKKGISNCRVQRVDTEYISRNGYEVYSRAYGRYKNLTYSPADEKTYYKDICSGKNYHDIVHYWGIFYQNKLIGYSSNFVFDKTEALYSTIKIDPGYLYLNPTSALMYEMNNSYLVENGFEYVNDGYRTLLHDTNFQDFLIKKFNFIKAGLRLEVYYKPLYSAIINASYPLRKIIRYFDPRIEAILKLESIRRSYIGRREKI